MYAQLLRQCIKKEKKSLFFGNSSFIASEIMDLPREEVTKESTIDEYPALAALGFILGELDLRDRPKPKPFKRIKIFIIEKVVEVWGKAPFFMVLAFLSSG